MTPGKSTHERGMKVRREVLGDEHVDAAIERTTARQAASRGDRAPQERSRADERRDYLPLRPAGCAERGARVCRW